jgi:hypothetical protein
VPAGGNAQLDDPRRARDHDHEHAEDGGQEQGDAERKVPVRAEEGDVDAVAVFQDEDQQKQQHDGEGHGREPHAADPGAFDHVLGRQGRLRLAGWPFTACRRFDWGSRLFRHRRSLLGQVSAGPAGSRLAAPAPGFHAAPARVKASHRDCPGRAARVQGPGWRRPPRDHAASEREMTGGGP